MATSGIQTTNEAFKIETYVIRKSGSPFRIATPVTKVGASVAKVGPSGFEKPKGESPMGAAPFQTTIPPITIAKTASR